MNIENLDQLKDEIKQEMFAALSQSKLGEMFQNNGLIGDKVVQFQCILDLTKLQPMDAVEKQQAKEVVVLCLCHLPGCPPLGCSCC